jgi:hypothetical protein
MAMATLKTCLVRLFCTIGVITTVVVPLLMLARANRSDGGLNIDEVNEAYIVAIAATVDAHFREAQALYIENDDHAVTKGVLEGVRQRTGISAVSTGPIDSTLSQRNCYKQPQEDGSTCLDVALAGTPLWRVWDMRVSSGDCSYWITIVRVSKEWRPLRISGGCTLSTPVGILE